MAKIGEILVALAFLNYCRGGLSQKQLPQLEDDYSHYDDEEYYDETEYYEEGSELEGEDGSGDYIYSYQDYNENSEESEMIEVIPEITSLPEIFVVQKGETAKLPCKATDASQLVRIWSRDDGNVIFTGAIKVSRQENYRLDKTDNTTLVVSNAGPGDAGSYTCRVMVRAQDEVTVTHRLMVNTQSFVVSPVPENGPIEVEEQENLELECKIAGEDAPQTTDGEVRWTRDGSRFRDGSYTMSAGAILKIDNVTKDDGGFYFCTATSTKGETKSAQIEVRVLFSPKVVALNKVTIRTGNGLAAELTCVVTGQPEPKVSWYKGTEVLRLNDRIITANAGSKHILTINRLRSDDIGQYMCYITNDLGAHQKTLMFTAEDIMEQTHDLEKTSNSGMSERKAGIVSRKLEELAEKTTLDREALELFRQRVEADMASLRNLTYRAISQGNEGSSSDTMEQSVFSDLQRLQMELGSLKTSSERSIRDLVDFQRKSMDDFQILWDHVNELQEVSNLTTKNMEDIYDKDILSLQNFKSTTENEMAKLRSEMDEFLSLTMPDGELKSGGYTEDSVTQDVSTELLWTKRKIDNLEDDQKRTRDSMAKMQESQNILTTEINKIFQDIDAFKKEAQSLNQDQLRLQREIQRIEDVDMTDMKNELTEHDRALNDFEHFKEKAITDFNEAQGANEDRFTVVVKEMQKIKSQIYYLQQSILQLRNPEVFSQAGENGFPTTTTEGSVVPLPPKQSDDNSFENAMDLKTSDKKVSRRLNKLEDKISKCAKQNDLARVSSEIETSSRQFSSAIDSVNEQVRLLKEAADGLENGLSASNRKSAANENRIFDLVASQKKYNVIIRGIRQEKRLERPSHLEALVKRFFVEMLNLNSMSFDEVERIKPVKEGDVVNNGAPVQVKFPNIREKVRILQAGRAASKLLKEAGITVGEDFTEQVLKHRQRLAAFARRRAKQTKKKWALKYDELFFNGKVFVFDETQNRVVPKNV